MQTAGITMKRQTETHSLNLRQHYDKEVCHKCGAKARFKHKGIWWCSWENLIGAYNLVGKCKNERKNENSNA